MGVTPRSLVYQCPDCSHKLKRAEGYNVATQVIRRACGGCGARWQVIIKPVRLKRGNGWADVAEFVKIKEGVKKI